MARKHDLHEQINNAIPILLFYVGLFLL